ncbi:hypothetical protein DFH09DRAFT_1216111 [Mycena vulgaris]|nr:hypothetical protein DFH09DRAFT_1216111 [Mycena vulgaris]
MFSKILAFGLAALTLVRAAPSFQVPVASRSVNLGTSVGATEVNTLGVIKPGIYSVINDATNTVLRDYQQNDPIFVSYTREFPGDFGLWQVTPAADGSNEYRIFNVGLQTPTFVGNDSLVISGNPGGARDSFSIEPAGDGVFVVRVPNEDKIWTVANPSDVRSSVKVDGQNGSPEQKWRFVPPSDF